MCVVGIKLSQEISEHNRFQVGRADQNEFFSRLLDTDWIAQLLLCSKCLVQLLQPWDEVKDGRDNEQNDQEFPWPRNGRVVTISHGAHGDHNEPQGVEVIQLDVATQHMMDHTHPAVTGSCGDVVMWIYVRVEYKFLLPVLCQCEGMG